MIQSSFEFIKTEMVYQTRDEMLATLGASVRAALLLFYEQNNISAFKKIFLEQVAFAVNEYF